MIDAKITKAYPAYTFGLFALGLFILFQVDYAYYIVLTMTIAAIVLGVFSGEIGVFPFSQRRVVGSELWFYLNTSVILILVIILGSRQSDNMGFSGHRFWCFVPLIVYAAYSRKLEFQAGGWTERVRSFFLFRNRK